MALRDKLIHWDEYCEIFGLDTGSEEPDWYERDLRWSMNLIIKCLAQSHLVPTTRARFLQLKQEYRTDVMCGICEQIKFGHENQDVIDQGWLNANNSFSIGQYSQGPMDRYNIDKIFKALCPAAFDYFDGIGWTYNSLTRKLDPCLYYNDGGEDDEYATKGWVRINVNEWIDEEVSSERQQRMDGDADLKRRIDTEKEEREAADQILDNKITQEREERTLADNVLDNKITQEISTERNARITADNELNTIKQNKLIAGSNIIINQETNTISATNTGGFKGSYFSDLPLVENPDTYDFNTLIRTIAPELTPMNNDYVYITYRPSNIEVNPTEDRCVYMVAQGQTEGSWVWEYRFVGDISGLENRVNTLELTKLDATKCTYQRTAPSAPITDGGVHIVVLSEEPEQKFEGYLYFIDGTTQQKLPSFIGMIITGDDNIATLEQVRAIYGTETIWKEIEQGTFIEAAGNGNQALQPHSPGLPNITGKVLPDEGGQEQAITTSGSTSGTYESGPFTSVKGGNDIRGMGGSWCTAKITFDASKSNPIYGASETVQPKSITAHIWRRTF